MHTFNHTVRLATPANRLAAPISPSASVGVSAPTSVYCFSGSSHPIGGCTISLLTETRSAGLVLQPPGTHTGTARNGATHWPLTEWVTAGGTRATASEPALRVAFVGAGHQSGICGSLMLPPSSGWVSTFQYSPLGYMSPEAPRRAPHWRCPYASSDKRVEGPPRGLLEASEGLLSLAVQPSQLIQLPKSAQRHR